MPGDAIGIEDAGTSGLSSDFRPRGSSHAEGRRIDGRQSLTTRDSKGSITDVSHFGHEGI